MIISIASGKGGTGKTTIATNLAVAMQDRGVQVLDCDVEEPNAHLFFAGNKVKEEIVTIPIPQVDEALCDGCGECLPACAAGALALVNGKAVLARPDPQAHGISAHAPCFVMPTST